jgi:hypothetical protein
MCVSLNFESVVDVLEMGLQAFIHREESVPLHSPISRALAGLQGAASACSLCPPSL